MRLAVILALVLTASAALAQAGLWSHVSPESGPQRLQPANLSPSQVKSFANYLRRQKPESIWECEGPDLDDLIKGLTFQTIPLPNHHDLVLAEAGAGCARGGQGANGAMWLMRFDRATPTILATPKDFSGWLFSIQPTLSHGVPDIVTGWHMSAAEAGLSYMRFDGKSYRSIAAAKLVTDDNDNTKIVPSLR
jgi:hypothetical protein